MRATTFCLTTVLWLGSLALEVAAQEVATHSTSPILSERADFPVRAMTTMFGPPQLASAGGSSFATQPIDFNDPWLEGQTESLSAGPPIQGPPGARKGVFQKINVTGTWQAGRDVSELGWTDLDLNVVLGFPFPRRETPLLITPRFVAHWLDGPVSPDLPARLYDAEIQWRHMRELSPTWAMDVAVTTGYYSDFVQDSGDAFRLSGRGVAVWTRSPVTKWLFGVAYLNRAGATVIPVAGILYTPYDGIRYEFIAPRPRIAWRLEPWSSPGCDERWFYVAGEFGGGIWAFERPDGSADLVTSRDYRIVTGIERKVTGGLTSRFELGYVFGRELEFDSATPDFEPDDTVLLRLGLTY